MYPPRYRLFVARIQAGTRTATSLYLRICVLASTYLHLRIRTDTRMQIRRYKNVAVRIRVRKPLLGRAAGIQGGTRLNIRFFICQNLISEGKEVHLPDQNRRR